MCATWQQVIGLAWVVGPRGIVPMGQQTLIENRGMREEYEKGVETEGVSRDNDTHEELYGPTSPPPRK